MNHLKDKKVVVTRTRKQGSKLVELLEENGADVIEIPTIKIGPPQDKQEFVQLVTDVHTYDWLIFTSPNGVEQFFEAFYIAYADARSLGGAKIAAVGPSTKAVINNYRFAVDLMPETYIAEELVKTFANDESVEHLTMLWVRGNEAREVIVEGLSALGSIVDECIAYETLVETEDPTGGKAKLKKEGADFITFASGSAVDHYFKLDLPWPKNAKAVSIGPVTSAALKAHGIDAIEAKTSTMESMVEAMS